MASLPLLTCTPKMLPDGQRVAAAQRAAEINPANRPHIEQIAQAAGPNLAMPRPELLAVLTSKYWGAAGVDLRVGFLEETQGYLADRIVGHMNAWGEFGQVRFTRVGNPGDAEVRISRRGAGYWSYLGTDILSIPRGEPTMNLQGFSEDTPDSEYFRVIRHETGHTLGFPHEHLRRELIDLLDPRKVIAWGARSLGWNERTVREQILTPLDEASVMGTPHADARSIMCYQLPGEVTRSGDPIPGGTDIDQLDRDFIAKLYPLKGQPGPTGDLPLLTLDGPLPGGSFRLRQVGAEKPAAPDLRKPDNLTPEQWSRIIDLLLQLLGVFGQAQQNHDSRSRQQP